MTKFTHGNQAAVKPADLSHTSRIVLRLTPAEKAALIQAAYPKSLSTYIRSMLKIGEMQSNARLIAAAPDLLNALKFLVECSAPMTGQQEQCWIAIRRAIAKATGVSK